MNRPPSMKEWPEFVTDTEGNARRGITAGELTGWESVVFVVDDDYEEGSDFSTAAEAP
jgi:hypothetical protein